MSKAEEGNLCKFFQGFAILTVPKGENTSTVQGLKKSHSTFFKEIRSLLSDYISDYQDTFFFRVNISMRRKMNNG